MPDLGVIDEAVRFAFQAATSLAAELRTAARQLDDQVGLRRSGASSARAEWRGTFGDQFDARVATSTGDAGRFAAAMRRAADQLEELAARARAEEQRRSQAREWKDGQDNEDLLNKTGDLLFGEDDLPPPPAPDPPRRLVTEAPPVPSRGPASPRGLQ